MFKMENAWIICRVLLLGAYAFCGVFCQTSDIQRGRTRQTGQLIVSWLGRKMLVCIRMELDCKFARQKQALGWLGADNVIVVLPASG